MIPKIIYTTWISDKPYPEQYQKYFDGWKELMSDYQIVIIGLDNIIKGNFVNKYIDLKKYGAAANYARCQNLYNTGGLYFDTDIEAIKRFDFLLDNKCFIGREDEGMVNNAVIGCQAGDPFMKECMEYMDYYIGIDNVELETGPWMFNKLYKNHQVKVYPEEYFYPYHYTKTFTPDCIKENTYAVHHWGKTWAC